MYRIKNEYISNLIPFISWFFYILSILCILLKITKMRDNGIIT
jgi:hypothetical protein